MAVLAPILASACLCGQACRYDGGDSAHPLIQALCAKGLAVPVCPELLGGLPTPRAASEIRDGRVISCLGHDLTAQFRLGAREALEIARKAGVCLAVFKDKSPSCGSRLIYDGTFSGRLVYGSGVAARLLMEHGIQVVAEFDFAGESRLPVGN